MRGGVVSRIFGKRGRHLLSFDDAHIMEPVLLLGARSIAVFGVRLLSIHIFYDKKLNIPDRFCGIAVLQ